MFYSNIFQSPGPVSSHSTVVLFGRWCLSARSLHDFVSPLACILATANIFNYSVLGTGWPQCVEVERPSPDAAVRTACTSTLVGERYHFRSYWFFSLCIITYRPWPYGQHFSCLSSHRQSGKLKRSPICVHVHPSCSWSPHPKKTSRYWSFFRRVLVFCHTSDALLMSLDMLWRYTAFLDLLRKKTSWAAKRHYFARPRVKELWYMH